MTKAEIREMSREFRELRAELENVIGFYADEDHLRESALIALNVCLAIAVSMSLALLNGEMDGALELVSQTVNLVVERAKKK
jgi:hypothetical protein